MGMGAGRPCALGTLQYTTKRPANRLGRFGQFCLIIKLGGFNGDRASCFLGVSRLAHSVPPTSLAFSSARCADTVSPGPLLFYPLICLFFKHLVQALLVDRVCPHALPPTCE